MGLAEREKRARNLHRLPKPSNGLGLGIRALNYRHRQSTGIQGEQSLGCKDSAGPSSTSDFQTIIRMHGKRIMQTNMGARAAVICPMKMTLYSTRGGILQTSSTLLLNQHCPTEVALAHTIFTKCSRAVTNSSFHSYISLCGKEAVGGILKAILFCSFVVRTQTVEFINMGFSGLKQCSWKDGHLAVRPGPHESVILKYSTL
ncbi:hypothetical protein C8R45DRAFT_942886 [Mycena sanguinolenta]|nr:hypothetical protein C8R45DRAFT_942886 [Mycena sanguinolenta]